MTQKSRVDVGLTLNHDRSDLDLFLYDHRVVVTPPVDGSLDFSRAIGTREQIECDLKPGVYYVKVLCFGDGRSESVPYALTVSVGSVAPIDEPKQQAYPVLESSTGSVGIGHEYRSRWYKPTFAEGGTLVLEFRPRMKVGQLQFDVRTLSDRILASVTSATAPKRLRVPVAAGPHYFRIEPTTADATGTYAFNFYVEVPPPAPPPRPPPPPPPPDEDSDDDDEAPSPSPEPPPPVELPRSAATPLGNDSAVPVILGQPQPVSRWYSVKVPKVSRVTLDCRCEGQSVTLDLYRRGSDELVTRGRQKIVVKDVTGDFEVRVSIEPQGAARGALSLHIAPLDKDAGFTREPGKKNQ